MSVLGDIGGLQALMDRLPKAHLTMMNEHFSRYFFLSLFYIIPALGPQDIQRLLMMKNGSQGVKAFQNVTWIYLFLTVIILLLGLAAKVLLPELEQGDEALLVLFTQYLPTGLFGIAVIGILAVLMSTADSGLNTGSIMLINDVVIPFGKYIRKKDFSEAEKLKYAHAIAIVMGLGAIIFASLRVAIFELDVFIVSFWYSIVLAPLYFLIFNRKLQFKHFVLSVIISVSTFIFWEIFMKHITNIDSIFPGFFISFITVLFFYLLGGRQKVFSEKELKRKRLEEMA